MTAPISIIILTFNEEEHLPRLLKSINNLNFPIYILDSGSTDKTLEIAKDYNAVVLFNMFENHPKQWEFALKNFTIQTPWTLGLDADQIVTPELYKLLNNFDSNHYQDIDGIYFNRKNIFKGKWLKFGGYYPKYLLKLFKTGVGYSDTNENMDHRFIVTGKTSIWKQGHIIEENLKENKIAFWIAKHNRYSDLVAQEEFERINALRTQALKPNLFGDPYERMAYLKSLWWKMPLFLRPFLYFFYRYCIQLGFLDGGRGFIFHFLQGFWFRFVVDIKIYELKQQQKHEQASA